MNRPLITLFTAATLLAGPPFADANGLTSQGTQSVEITNNSPYAFAFTASPGQAIALNPYYQTTVPIPGNTTYRIGYVSGSSATGKPSVTFQESDQASTYGTIPIGGGVPTIGTQLGTLVHGATITGVVAGTYNVDNYSFTGTNIPANSLLVGYVLQGDLRTANGYGLVRLEIDGMLYSGMTLQSSAPSEKTINLPSPALFPYKYSVAHTLDISVSDLVGVNTYDFTIDVLYTPAP